MRIVVLDGHTLNPGDLSWAGLEGFGEVTLYDRTAGHDTMGRAAGAEILLTNKTVLDSDTIRGLTELCYIGVLATGYNVVDLAAARECNVTVTNVPTYGTRSVAQMVFAHILNLAQHVGDHAISVRDGQWTQSPDFCYWLSPLVELEGLTIGIVGFGRIGREVARVAEAFGMNVLAHDVASTADAENVRFVDMETLFTESDVVTLHCPLTAGNEGFVNEALLSSMKPTSFLVNTARGPLLDEVAVAEALNEGRIAGAGLDVLSVEPAQAGNPLLSARNCYITPHIAWATKSARQRLMDTAVANLEAFLRGEPVNTVTRDVEQCAK
jgi:glycerate dehydrogenase